MIKLTPRQQEIIYMFLGKEKMQSGEVYDEINNAGEELSLITVKRALAEMVRKEVLEVFGSGRSTSYRLSIIGRIFLDINVKQYIDVEPDKRYGFNRYNFDLLDKLSGDIFTNGELKKLETATGEYKRRIVDLSTTIQKKELERLVVELSWKSSRIEGNTYTLLDTEKLLLENKEAPGHTKSETQMIINHKNAFEYIRQNSKQYKTITRKNMEELHTLLVKDLNVSFGLRNRPVGVTGSIYRPLDNLHQITDAVDKLGKTISLCKSPYAKALVALLGISYIQPFEDGNKRTARLMTNAILMAHSLSPLSYRSVDEQDYRSSMLVFYELNSIMPMKKIFIEQYEFATQNYTVN